MKELMDDQELGDLFGPHKAKVQGKGSESLIDNDKKKEYVSAWIKALRLGRLEDAFYWMHVVIEQLGEWYMARRMIIFAGEDCWDPHAIPLATTLMTLVEKKTPDICNHFNYVNAYFCTCPKFWNTPGGIDMYRMWLKLDIREKVGVDGKIIPEEVPSWAIDMHTATGREAASNKEWDKLDRRFGGDNIGIYTKILMFKRLGRLDPEAGDEDYWEAFHLLKELKEAMEADKQHD